MARIRGHRALNADQPLYVRRTVITLAGKSFRAGEVLPWKDLGVEPRKLYQLWEQRRIGHEKASERTGAETPAVSIDLPGIASASVAAKIDQAEQAARNKRK